MSGTESCAIAGFAIWNINLGSGVVRDFSPILYPGVTASVLSVVVPQPPTLRLYDVSDLSTTPDEIASRSVTEVDALFGYGATGQFSYAFGIKLEVSMSLSNTLVIYNGGTALHYMDSVIDLPGRFADGTTAATVSLGSQSIIGDVYPWIVQAGQYMFFVSVDPITHLVTLVGLDTGGPGITGMTGSSGSTGGSTGNTLGYPTVVLYQSTGTTNPHTQYLGIRQQIAVELPYVYVTIGSTVQIYELFDVPQYQSIGATLRSSIGLTAHYPDCSVGVTGNLLHIMGSTAGSTGGRYLIYSVANPSAPVLVGGCTIPTQSNQSAALLSVRSISILPGNLTAVSIFTGLVIVNVQGTTEPFFQQLFGGSSPGETSVHFMNAYHQSGVIMWGQQQDVAGTSGLTMNVLGSSLLCALGYQYISLSPCVDVFGNQTACAPLPALRRAITMNSLPFNVVDEVTQFNGSLIALRCNITGTTGWIGPANYQPPDSSADMWFGNVPDTGDPVIAFFEVVYLANVTPPAFRLLEFASGAPVNHCLQEDFVWWGQTQDDTCSICRWIFDVESQYPQGIEIYQGAWGEFHNMYESFDRVSAHEGNFAPVWMAPVTVIPNPYMQAFLQIEGDPSNVVQCCLDNGSASFLQACHSLGYYSPLSIGNTGAFGLCNTFMTTVWCPANMAEDPNCTAYCQIPSVNCDSMLLDYCFLIGSTAAVGSSTCSCFMGSAFYQTFFNTLISIVEGLDLSQEITPICTYTPCSLALAAGLVPYIYKQPSPPGCPDEINCIDVTNVTNLGTFNANDVTISQQSQCSEYRIAPTGGTGSTGSTGSTGTTQNELVLIIALAVVAVLAVVALILAIVFGIRAANASRGTHSKKKHSAAVDSSTSSTSSTYNPPTSSSVSNTISVPEYRGRPSAMPRKEIGNLS